MTAFFRKIKNLILHLSESRKNNSRIKMRQFENDLLREEKKSDIQRWQHNNELLPDWNERTIILGLFLKPNSRIIEFGAGNMVLKNTLTDYETYTPSDIVKRFDETIVCDLNQPINFDISKYNAAILSGVLEYVYDLETVIQQLSKSINQIALSYCCSDIVKLSRDKNGWLSDYTKTELEVIFKKYGYTIEKYQEWRNQSLYNLVKQDI